MRYRILLLFAGLMAATAAPAVDPFTPLMLYNGTWRVTRKDAPKPDTLVNKCARTGSFFVCDQSVNAGASALLVFIPRADKPGQYYTQNIRPEGRATSRAEMSINGDVWTFLSTWDNGGQTTYYKTVNTFISKTRIEYEQSESANNKDWKVTNSGEETRVAGR